MHYNGRMTHQKADAWQRVGGGSAPSLGLETRHPEPTHDGIQHEGS